MTLGPSRPHWQWRNTVLRLLLTSVSTNRVTPVAPPFEQALLTGTLHRPPQIRIVICPRPNATSTCTPSSSSVSRCHARSPGATGLECDFCTSPGGSWCEDVQRRFLAGLPIIFAGFLSTVCRLAAVALTSCYFLTSYSSGMMTPQRRTGIKHRGLAPHKITPMLGVHRDRGRIAADPSHTT